MGPPPGAQFLNHAGGQGDVALFTVIESFR
jgi:hypothetical protein